MPHPTYTMLRIQTPEAHLLDGVWALRRVLMAHHHRTPPEDRFIQRVTQQLDDETMFLALALDGEIPVAYSLAFDVEKHPFMPDWDHAGYITHFIVAADYRQHGVGEQFLAFVMDWFASRGLSQVMLNVAVENTAGNHFWRKMGFTPVATRMHCAVVPQG